MGVHWKNINGVDLCTCKECRWCKDAVIEMLENLCGSPRRLNEYLTSPFWYYREAAKKYLKEEAAIKRGEDPWSSK